VRLGYARGTICNSLRIFGFVSRWLERRRLQPRELRATQLEQLSRARRSGGHRFGRSKVLQFLREVGVVARERPAAKRTALDRLLERYREYLAEERGLSVGVVRWYGIVARRFLERRPREAPLRRLSAGELREFLREQARGFSKGQAAHIAGALRSLVRYLHCVGLIPGPLAGAVPSISGWRGASLPQALPPGTVGTLLRGCDRRTLIGRRDYAVMMVLARLGLRAGEVAGLDLDAIDWRHGEMVVHGKGKTLSRLPLPHDVGEALSAYLVRRPRVDSRALFLRSRAPLQRLTQTGVTHIVALAAQRAGLARTSPHQLRHTLATEMLRRGATLAHIAQVLRHRSLSTTAIYAKVDRVALRELAQPWPGGVA
jgi:site-specific recombinase XerD